MYMHAVCLTKVVWDVLHVWFHHGRVQVFIVSQQLQIPGVVFKVGLETKKEVEKHVKIKGKFSGQGVLLQQGTLDNAFYTKFTKCIPVELAI